MKAKYKVWSYDVWGHSYKECSKYGCPSNGCCEGYTINDRFPVGEIELTYKNVKYNIGTPHEFKAEKITNASIIRALKKAELLKKHVQISKVEIDGETDFDLYLVYIPTGYPLFQLERTYV